MSQRPEADDVQALVPDPAVEGLHIAIAPRRTRWNVEEPGDLTRPVSHRLTDQLRTIVTPLDLRQPSLRGDRVQVGGEVNTGDTAGHDPAQTFTGVLINGRGDLDRTSGLIGVELEIHRPHHMRGGGARDFSGGGPDALAAALHRNP